MDILFMMDHSGSMQDDWERVANNMQNLVKELPADVDIRYAVVLGDVGSWKGKLFAPVGAPFVLDNQKMKVPEISQRLHKMFVEGMKVSDSGSGEALFFSLYHAVTGNASANQKLGFFRADAALSIIFMSDEQEIGFPFPSRTALAAQGLPYRCDETFEDGVKKDYYDKKGINLEVTWNAVKALKGDMPVKTHAFVNITKDDLFTRNPKNAKCLYDSIGYGYPEIVAKTKGVLFSIQADKAEGLSRCGKVINESLQLQHDFALSKPANKVDPATILAVVDQALAVHTYNAGSNSVHLDDAGKAGSEIQIRHCEPSGQVAWNLTGFAGTPSQYSVGLSWATSEYSTNGKVLWGSSAASLSQEAIDPNAGNSHAVTVSGLSPNTVYYFQAVSWDEFGQIKRSSVLSFRTLPDWTISGLASQAARNSATIQWATSEYPTSGRVLYGTDPQQLSATAVDPSVANAHGVNLGSLIAGTTYFFKVVASDEFGLSKSSAIGSFTTQPDWGISGFAGSPTRTSVALDWNTDEVALGTVRWGATPALGNQAQEVGAGIGAHRLLVSGLVADTDYFFQVSAVDSSGQQKTSPVIQLHTLADWQIGGFAGSSTQVSVDLSWTTLGYSTSGRVFWGSSDTSLNSVAVDSATGVSHSVTVSGLSPDTIYYFQASSVDADGWEKRSSVVAIRTQQVPLPTWSISNFAGTATKNSVSLSWNTDQYATQGKVLWGTALNGLNAEVNEAAAGTAHAVSVDGLAADTIYYFQAVGTDDRGQTKTSDVIAVRTMADPVINPPSNWVISGFDGTTTANTVSLIWQTTGAQTKATIKVGTSPSNLSLMVVDVPTYTDTHLETITGLNPSTTYYFQVITADNTGKTVESVIIAKTTKAK